MTLDTADIQGNVLRGYTFPHAAHLFFEIREPAGARAFLSTLDVTRATFRPASERPSTASNVCLSVVGLGKLVQRDGPFDEALFGELRARYRAFGEGMKARASLLGDAWQHAAADWSHADVWVTLFAKERTQLDARVAETLSAAGGRLRLLLGGPLIGQAIERGETRFEHFGFQDNISNPEIEGAREPHEQVPLNLGNGKRDSEGRHGPLRAGEFLLGHPNESGDLLLDDRLEHFVRNGSFVVFRDLAQHVHAFRKYVREAAQKLGREPRQVEALIVGRWADGRPLIESAPDDKTLNDFGYQHDRDGAKCPLASHVRRTHPRDASGIVEVSHRLLRRGMPYGPELKPDANDDDGTPRGLYFIALNADLERQFEFVQRRWINAPTGTGLDDDLDPLLSGSQTRPLRMVIPGTGPRPLPRVIDALAQFVEFRGGGYFFMPSLTALKALSRQDAAEARS